MKTRQTKSPKPIPRPVDPSDEDAGLIRAIHSGDTSRFAELVQRYGQRLYNFGLRMCRETRDAEDLVQETFLNVFHSLKHFRYETKFSNWLFKIASNLCLKKKRKSAPVKERELSLEEFIPDDPSQAPTETPDWATAPLNQVLSRELSEFIQDAIVSLPDKYRIVIVLRDVEGFDTQETARILGISPANVKVRLHRARLFVRDRLKGYFENDRP